MVKESSGFRCKAGVTKSLHTFCILVVSACCLSTAALGQIAFGPPTDYNVGGPSTVMAAADFNGDGYADLAVEANYSSSGDNVVVLMNKGDGSGTFGTPVTYLLPSGYVNAVLAADLNGDGHVDLVAAGGSTTGFGFFVLINNGDGTFQSPVFYADPNNDGAATNDWAVADFFGDGFPAVIEHPVGQSQPPVNTNLWANDGTGKFTLASQSSDTLSDLVAIADTNGDGLTDLVGESFDENCGKSNTVVCVDFGQGGGLFGPVTTYAANGRPYSIVDISSPAGPPDGFPDVVSWDGTPGTLSLLVNKGDGTGAFEKIANYKVTSWDPSWATTTDVDGDGMPEIVTADISNAVYADVFTYSVASGFSYAGQFLVGPYVTGCQSSFLGIDLNGDGLADLISTDCYRGHSNIHVLLNQSKAVGNASPVRFAPPALTFAPTSVGRASLVHTLTLNYASGSGLLNIDGVAATANFAVAKNNCPAKMGAGGVCTLGLTFTPPSSGTFTGTLTVKDNQTGSPQTVNLSGSAKDPVVTFTPPKLTFANQVIGTTSAGKLVKVTNTGTGDLVVSSVTASGNYAIASDKCSQTTVQQGKFCSFKVTFTPSVVGPTAGEITVTDDSNTSPQGLSLSGKGINPLSVNKDLLAFGKVPVGGKSSILSFNLTNNSPVTVGFSFSVSGDYHAKGTGSAPCGTSLASKAQCTYSAEFTPTQNGIIYGGMTINTTSAYLQTLPIDLSGTGTGGGTAPLKFVPSTLHFTNQVVGTSSAPQTVTVTNTSSSTVNILSFSATAPEFTSAASGTSPCGGPLMASQSCTFTVTFNNPESTGTIKGSVNVNTDNAVTPQIYGLVGTVILPVTLAPASLTFAPQSVGTTSAPQILTITNNQSTTLNIASIAASGQFTAVPGGTAPCGNTLAGLGQCTVAVTFSPAIKGAISGVVTITHDALGSPQEITLAGTGQ